MIVDSYLYHGHGHRDLLSVEIFSIKPLNGRLSIVGINVGHGGFSFRQPSTVVLEEDSLMACLHVTLDVPDGTKELGDVLRCGVSRKTLDKYLVVRLDLLHNCTKAVVGVASTSSRLSSVLIVAWWRTAEISQGRNTITTWSFRLVAATTN